MPLYLSRFKEVGYSISEVREIAKYNLVEEDLNSLKSYFDYFDDKRVLLVKYEIEPKILKTIEESLRKKEEYYKIVDNKLGTLDPEFIFSRIIRHFSKKAKEFDHFEKVEAGKYIVHFERIRFTEEKKEKLSEFLEKLEKIRERGEKETEIKEEQSKLFEFKLKPEDLFSEPFDGVKIKYVPHHYYYPIILSTEKEKIEYLNFVIKHKSEINFIENLEKYISKPDNLFEKNFDWWVFSKIEENVDDIFIPWYNPEENEMKNFYPDFIFWLCKGNKYYIIFVDPKSIKYTEYEHKVEWFRKFFEENNKPKVFYHEGVKIQLHLRLACEDINKIANTEFKKYWFDNIPDVLKSIQILNH